MAALPLAAPLAEAFYIVMGDRLDDVDLDALPVLFGRLRAKRFLHVRNVRLAFGGSEALRSNMITGFAAELAGGTGIPTELVETFLLRLWDHVENVHPDACFAPLSTGFFTQMKRPHEGIWVEVGGSTESSVVARAVAEERAPPVAPAPVVTPFVPGGPAPPPQAKIAKTLAVVAASALPQTPMGGAGAGPLAAEAPTARGGLLMALAKSRAMFLQH